MIKAYSFSAGICGLLCLASCAQPPIMPTAGVTPGPGKTDAAFAADASACKQTASVSIAGQVDAANRQATTGAVTGAAINLLSGGLSNVGSNFKDTASSAAADGLQKSQDSQGNIQSVYDAAYNQCMYAKGNNVPGMEAQVPQPDTAIVYRPAIVRDPLVQQVQAALVKLGYLHGGADGVAGPKTASAISQYETDAGLTVDGVASRNLLASLQAAEVKPSVQPAVASSGAGFDLPPPPASQ
jgi:hypothetical protein